MYIIKRNRASILDEYLILCSLASEPTAWHIREEIGDFVVSYHLLNKKLPSFRQIIEHCINENELKDLDVMYDTYTKYKNGEINQKEYQSISEKLLD